jgi:hypothetical protein
MMWTRPPLGERASAAMSSSSASRDHIALSRVVDVVEGAAAGRLGEDAGRAAEAGALRTAALSKLSR